MSHKRRLIDEPSKPDQNKITQQHLPSSNPNPESSNRKRPSFATYLETPNLPPKIKLLCEILADTPTKSVENSLAATGVRVSTEDVEQVLKLSYGVPGAAVKFFRWAGHQLNDKHSPYAWNLIVDMLGKNLLFDAMWDAIKSMKMEGLLSPATFASVFSSYVVADRVDEALMTFEVMDQYSCARDTVALNSLLSAICRDNQTTKAYEFLTKVKDRIPPDADTYAILLEGWENEMNISSARLTYGEMVLSVGWDPENVPAYDSFLNTLLKGPGGIDEAMKFFEMMTDKRCYPGLKFFKNASEEFFKLKDARRACSFWEVMVGHNGCVPDTRMYNSMIALHCHLNHVDVAHRYLDEMVYFGAFPDSQIYNVLLHYLIKNRSLSEASAIFNEMVKNECSPNHANCKSAVRVYLKSYDSDMAIKIWKCMLGNEINPLEDVGNELVVGLRDINMVPEARKYAEDMIERGIKLNSSTLSKLKSSLSKAGKGNAYDELLRKWKSH